MINAVSILKIYFKEITFISFSTNLFYKILILLFQVHDLWSKGRPAPADFKLGSVYDYYDIFEEIGR